MALELDNAAQDLDRVAVDETNPSDPGAIIDPSTLLPFESQNLSEIFKDGSRPDQAPVPDSGRLPDASTKERYEYWQAQADKERTARLVAEQELRVLRPVMQLVQNDEQLFAAVSQRLNRGAQPAEPTLKSPLAPERPVSYSEAEAYTNPQSESFKFRMASEKFIMDKMNYLEALNRQTLEQSAQREAQMAEQGKRARVLEQTEQLVQTQYNLRPEEARDFVRWSSSDQSVTLPNLVSFYKFLKSGGKLPGAEAGPVPALRGGGTPPVVDDANARWNAAMFGKRK